MARILVIEDNPANLELMTYLLEAFGHITLSAADGTAGLALALSVQPDLIVCDVQLPGLDGYAIARHLKADAALRTIPLVAVTALAMVGDRDQILAAGFDGYISKPIVPETFVEQVEVFLAPIQRATSAPAGAPMSATPAVAAPVHKGITVMIVDDRPLNHELMRSLLEPFGYTVATAGSVREALALARALPPNLIVSDLHMPEQTGFDLLRAVKADPQLRHIKILIHSATSQLEHERQEALRLGASAFFMRPMEPSIFLAEITTHLQAHQEHMHGNDPCS